MSIVKSDLNNKSEEVLTQTGYVSIHLNAQKSRTNVCLTPSAEREVYMDMCKSTSVKIFQNQLLNPISCMMDV